MRVIACEATRGTPVLRGEGFTLDDLDRRITGPGIPERTAVAGIISSTVAVMNKSFAGESAAIAVTVGNKVSLGGVGG